VLNPRRSDRGGALAAAQGEVVHADHTRDRRLPLRYLYLRWVVDAWRRAEVDPRKLHN
jgi:hypothetical protein